jgi:hypothetical protein
MGRRVVFALLVALMCAAAPASAKVAPDARGKAQLSVVRLGPLMVRGVAFRPYERVTVTLTVRRTFTRKVRATRGGRFVVGFRSAAPTCGSVLLRARGTQGSRVVYELPRPDCREP